MHGHGFVPHLGISQRPHKNPRARVKWVQSL
jgi:hypothetical protein